MTFFKLDEYLSGFLHAALAIPSAFPFSASPCMSPSILSDRIGARLTNPSTRRALLLLDRDARGQFAVSEIRKGLKRRQGLSSTIGASQNEIAMRALMIPVSALFVCLFGTAALADEGMWTFDNFPTAAVKAEIRRSHRSGLAGPCARRGGAAFDRLFGLHRHRRRPGSDQSSLRARLRPAAFQRQPAIM